MATVGDYVTFGDSAVTLEIGGPDTDNSYPFSLPSNLNRDSNAILTLLMEAESPKDLQWNAVLNGTTLFTLTHNTDRFCTFQEIFSGGTLNVGANTLTVKVLGGKGRIKVSNFALHHQVNV